MVSTLCTVPARTPRPRGLRPRPIGCVSGRADYDRHKGTPLGIPVRRLRLAQRATGQSIGGVSTPSARGEVPRSDDTSAGRAVGGTSVLNRFCFFINVGLAAVAMLVAGVFGHLTSGLRLLLGLLNALLVRRSAEWSCKEHPLNGRWPRSASRLAIITILRSDHIPARWIERLSSGWQFLPCCSLAAWPAGLKKHALRPGNRIYLILQTKSEGRSASDD